MSIFVSILSQKLWVSTLKTSVFAAISTIMVRRSMFSIIIPAIILFMGCTPQQDTQTQSAEMHAEALAALCTPVKVAVIQDNSGSINWTGTPVVQPDDLIPLIQLLYRCGGSIGFGLISENSNKGLIRLFINTPPLEPVEPSRKGNPQKVATRFDIYRHELSKFKKEFGSWKKNIETTVSIFMADIDLSLKNNREAKKTDIWQALDRADLFLSESSNTWGNKPQGYALIITDGVDNVRKAELKDLKSKAQLLMVNSTGSVGVLDKLNPAMFESIAPAVRFIIADMEGKR